MQTSTRLSLDVNRFNMCEQFWLSTTCCFQYLFRFVRNLNIRCLLLLCSHLLQSPLLSRRSKRLTIQICSRYRLTVKWITEVCAWFERIPFRKIYLCHTWYTRYLIMSLLKVLYLLYKLFLLGSKVKRMGWKILPWTWICWSFVS